MELLKWNNEMEPELRCPVIKSNSQQCTHQIVPGTTRCPLHGANAQLASAEKKSLDMYRLAKYQARVDELKEHNEVKTLRNEIGVLRMLLEEKMNRANTDAELVMMAGPISDLVMKIEKLVSSCQRLENSLGNLLDKQQMKNIATQLLNVLTEKVNDLKLSEEEKGTFIEIVASAFLAIMKGQEK